MKKIWDCFVNIIHFIIWCFLLHGIIMAITGVKLSQGMRNYGTNIRIILDRMGISEIYTFIGSIAFVLFGVIGIYDFAYLNGLLFFVPPMYVHMKEKNYNKQAEKMMELYYKKDIQFIQEYEKERTGFLLQAMGIEEKQFHLINYEIIKARTKPEKSIYALRCKAESMLLRRDYIINQKEIESSKRVYDKVDYFINFYTALYDASACKSIGGIMCRFIVLSLKEKIVEINYIVVPEESNFLLGLEVGRILHKPVISILHKGRICNDEFWDAEYNKNKINNIIVIHDVLVTGECIYKSIEKLPSNSYNLYGIFCLVKYNSKDFFAINDFKKHKIDEKVVNWILDVDEKILKEVDEGKYEYQYK